MARIHETISGQRNFVERLVQHVPGFRGYFDRENRREADKLLRDYGVSRLDRLISELHDATKAAELAVMDEYQELVNQAEKLRNELRHSDRGYSGFFAEVKWDDPGVLDALYEHDERIVEELVEIEALVSNGELDVASVRARIRKLSRSLEDRKNAILGLATE